MDGFSEFQAVLWMSIIYVVVRIKKLFAKLFFLLFVPGHPDEAVESVGVGGEGGFLVFNLMIFVHHETT